MKTRKQIKWRSINVNPKYKRDIFFTLVKVEGWNRPGLAVWGPKSKKWSLTAADPANRYFVDDNKDKITHWLDI